MAQFLSAHESENPDAPRARLTDDALIAVPRMPFEYEGRDLVVRFCAGLFGAGRRFSLLRTRANGQPAFGAICARPTHEPRRWFHRAHLERGTRQRVDALRADFN